MNSVIYSHRPRARDPSLRPGGRADRSGSQGAQPGGPARRPDGGPPGRQGGRADCPSSTPASSRPSHQAQNRRYDLPREDHPRRRAAGGRRGLRRPSGNADDLAADPDGRRSSEIRTCVSPPVGGARPSRLAGGEHPVRFTYVQTKIDIAPGSILVDREIAAIIEAQQEWIRQRSRLSPRLCCSSSPAGISTAPSPARKAATAPDCASNWFRSSTARAVPCASATSTGPATPG
jgi:hypothetical protein